MNGIIERLLLLLLLAGLSGCVTEVQEVRARNNGVTRISVEPPPTDSFNFRTVASPLPQQTGNDGFLRSNSNARSNTTPPDPSLVYMGGVQPQFETYSKIGNSDYEVFGKNYKVWRDIEQYSEEGTASWYGPGFHGRFTSNGEVYDQYAISAAHKNLPIPCYVRVTNLENNRTLVVRINDRGPFHDKRILDLSFGAAQRLGIVGQGVAKVRLDLIHAPRPANAGELIARSQAKTIQLLATNNAQNAHDQAERLSRKFGTPIQIVAAKQVFRLHMGPLPPAQADAMLAFVRDRGLPQAYFVN